MIAGEPGHSRGVVLIVSLLLLVVLTLLAAMGMRGTLMQEKMAGNMRDRDVAFQAAESAVRAAEKWLSARDDPPPRSETDLSGHPDMVYSPEVDLRALPALSQAWWNDDNNTRPGPAIPLSAHQPRYAVQYLDFRPDTYDVGFAQPQGRSFYRIIGHGTGITESARVVIQTTFDIRHVSIGN